MTKRLRLGALLRYVVAIATVALAVPTPLFDAGDAVAAKRKKKKPKPEPTPTPEPVPETPAPVEIDEPGAPQPIDVNPDATPAPATQPAAPAAPLEVTPPGAKEEGQKVSWSDIVVVVRKPFLKDGRLELMPSWNVTLNDNMIRHHALRAQLAYWLTDVLAVGVEGQFFTHFGFLEPKTLVGQSYRRLPTLNEYKWAAALNFHYAPVYAKFAVFNKWMVHWEGMFTAGVGIVQSSVIPRDTNFQGWNNFLIAPNVGFEMRLFVSRWLTLDLGVRDYIFVDKFENVNRMTADVEAAKAEASSQLINNVMATVGFSFWIPPTFSYTTFR